jgi:hypothetical protein
MDIELIRDDIADELGAVYEIITTTFAFAPWQSVKHKGLSNGFNSTIQWKAYCLP